MKFKNLTCLWILTLTILLAAPLTIAETTVEVYGVGETTFDWEIPEVRYLRGSVGASKTVPCTADVAELFAAINGSYSFTYRGEIFWFAKDPKEPPNEVTNPLLQVPSTRSYTGGGKVILRGDFDSGNVIIQTDGSRNEQPMVIIGKSVEITGVNATIKRGRFEIYASETDDIKINNLTFENSVWAAISAEWDFGSLTIDSVHVNGVKSMFEYWLGGPYMRYGIRVGWWEDPPLQCESVLISNSHIDLVGEDEIGNPISPYEVGLNPHGQGITTYGMGTPTYEVDVSIEGNTIKNCSRHAIFLYDLAGRATVKDNIIRSGSYGPGWFGTTPNGIWSNQTPWMYYYFPPGYWDTYHADWVHLTIKNNDIHCGPNTFASGARSLGIIAYNQVGTVIKGNNIRVDNGFDCIDIFNESDGFNVTGNTCTGSGSYNAIWVAGSARNCNIKNNDFSAATPTDAQVWIEPGANNNSVKNNDLGPEGWFGGIYCAGFNNHFRNNTFHGDYPGWPESGFVLLDEQSLENHVVALKKATPPHGFDLCDQVMDLGSKNKIPGYKKCNH